jgi:glycosyltransferase involved in cell wall biosynthesis
VLFMAEEHGGHTRYRCDHQAEELSFLGASCDVAQYDDVNHAEALERYECFVLHRLRWSDGLASLIERATAAEKLVVFDSDDLIFEPSHVDHFAFLDDAPEAARASWLKKLERYRKTLQACDGAMVSTEPLADYTRELTNRVEVVFNAVSAEMVKQADDALTSARPQANGDVTLAYLSGTRTHNRDFLVAADALLWALETYPAVLLLAVGPLDLDPRFERYASRVQTMPEQPWQRLPEIIAGIDVNLAPLERDSPFTTCKSCVKYAEAGLLGVPTVASPAGDFVRAIEHGRNGFLADSDADWHDTLRQLITSPELRREMGSLAFEDVRRRHTTKATARTLERGLSALGQRNGRLVVNWLAQDDQYDGFHLPDQLARAGHTVRQVGPRSGDLPAADVGIATDASTARTLAADSRSLFKCHLISTIDDDPSVYDLPLRPICLGDEVAETLGSLTNRPVDRIEAPAQFEEILQQMCFTRLQRRRRLEWRG